DVGVGEIGAGLEACVLEPEPSRWETSETDGQVERPTTAVSGDQGVASRRACVEYDGRATCTANFATFVDKSRIASCRSVEECQFAVIAEGGIASARATCKNDSSRVCKRS